MFVCDCVVVVAGGAWRPLIPNSRETESHFCVSIIDKNYCRSQLLIP